MTVSPEYRAFAEDQLGRIVRLRSRAMFGGVGFYAEDLFFGFLADDVLYFKVDEETRARYEARDMKPFLAPGETMSSYYQVPDGLLDDLEELRSWVESAVESASRSKGRKKPRTRRSSPFGRH